jgi:anti-anti-sigma factor
MRLCDPDRDQEARDAPLEPLVELGTRDGLERPQVQQWPGTADGVRQSLRESHRPSHRSPGTRAAPCAKLAVSVSAAASLGNAVTMGRLNVDRAEGRILRLSGEIDVSTADVLLDAAVSAPGSGDLTLDLADVTLVDSTGVQALLRVRDAIDGATLVVRNPSRRVAAVLELVQAQTWPRFDIEPELPRGEDRSA